MQPHPHPERFAVRPGVLRKSPLRRHRRPYSISGAGECHQDGVPLDVDLLPARPSAQAAAKARYPQLRSQILVEELNRPANDIFSKWWADKQEVSPSLIVMRLDVLP